MSKQKNLSGIGNKKAREAEFDRKVYFKKKNINLALIIVFLIFFILATTLSLKPIFSVKYKISASSFDNSLENKIVEDLYKEQGVMADTKDLPFENAPKEFKDIEDLQSLLNQEAEKVTGRYGVYVKNIKDGRGIKLKEKERFTAASLSKLFVAGAYYKKISEDPFFDDDGTEIRSYDVVSGNGFITESEVGAKYGYKDICYAMLNQSDNTAFMMMTREVGLGYIESFIEENGFVNTDFRNNDSSPEDVGMFFEKAYSGSFFDLQKKSDFFESLKNTVNEDRIPYYLPSSVSVSHKIGTWTGAYSDAGIVFSPKGDYIIVVMSEDAGYEESINFIRKISQIVYEYFNQ